MLMRMRVMEQCYTIGYIYAYEDEDHQDLSSKDCADTIKLHRQIEINGEIEIDEWTIGDE